MDSRSSGDSGLRTRQLDARRTELAARVRAVRAIWRRVCAGPSSGCFRRRSAARCGAPRGVELALNSPGVATLGGRHHEYHADRLAIGLLALDVRLEVQEAVAVEILDNRAAHHERQAIAFFGRSA